MAETGAQTSEGSASPHHPNQLRAVREAAGMSLQEVADAIGVSKQTVQAWESGRNALKGDNILKLSEALGCTPNDILGYSKEGPLAGKLRAMTPELEEICDLYLDNDLTMQTTIRQILYTNAHHRRPRRH